MNATLTRISHQLDTVAGVVTVTIPGDILSTNADALRAELFDLLEAPQIKGSPWHTLKLDLTGAQMVDSVGLNLIVSLVRAVKARQGTVAAAISSANILRTFKFTRLDKQITLGKA